jgi:hypothetical protein
VVNYSVGDAADPVAGIDETPAEVHIRAISKRFVESVDHIERFTPEGEVASAALRQVLARPNLLFAKRVQSMASRYSRDGASRDVLVLVKGGD